MRKSTTTMALAALATSALACSSGTANPPPAPIDWHAFDLPRTADAGAPGPTPKERALGEQYVKALAAADFAQLPALLDADSHFAFPGMSDARGHDAVVKAHQALFGAFDQRAVGVSRVWRTDSEQTVEWTLTGTQARDWMGVPATHKPVAIKGLTLLWTKDDGIITDVHVYFDVAAVQAQLGVGPKELLALPAPALPAGAPEVYEQTGLPQEQMDVTVARAKLDALESNNEAGYLATMTDDIELHTLERGQPMRGKDDAKAYFRSMRKAITQLDTTIDDAWGVTTYAVVEYFIAGEQLGPLGWIPAQRDRVVRLQIVDVDEIRDGKIARVWRYDNPAQIAAPGL
jgi:steroid delta-isomerase-like uncharacterized protein